MDVVDAKTRIILTLEWFCATVEDLAEVMALCPPARVAPWPVVVEAWREVQDLHAKISPARP